MKNPCVLKFGFWSILTPYDLRSILQARTSPGCVHLVCRAFVVCVISVCSTASISGQHLSLDIHTRTASGGSGASSTSWCSSDVGLIGQSLHKSNKRTLCTFRVAPFEGSPLRRTQYLRSLHTRCVQILRPRSARIVLMISALDMIAE